MNLPIPEMVFGWPGDDGLGERIVNQITSGEKTATCSFKIGYDEATLNDVFNSVGRWYAIKSAEGEARGVIQITDVFETTFGNPDPRLVEGSGDGTLEAFKESRRLVWESMVGEMPLGDDEPMVVELFKYMLRIPGQL